MRTTWRCMNWPTPSGSRTRDPNGEQGFLDPELKARWLKRADEVMTRIHGGRRCSSASTPGPIRRSFRRGGGILLRTAREFLYEHPRPSTTCCGACCIRTAPGGRSVASWCAGRRSPEMTRRGATFSSWPTGASSAGGPARDELSRPVGRTRASSAGKWLGSDPARAVLCSGRPGLEPGLF